MKRNMNNARKIDVNMKKKVISNTGREWSSVSIETERDFDLWLIQSGIEREEILERTEKDDFKIKYLYEKDEIRVYLEDDSGTIGLPFVWEHDEVPLTHFKMDAAIMLLYISSLCGNSKSKKKIQYFIKNILIHF